MKAYIASGFFNDRQKMDLELIKKALEMAGISYFSPMDANLALPDDSQEKRKMIFDVNVDEIAKSDLIIANTRDKDMGTIFEAGFAYATSVPIIYFWSQSGRPETSKKPLFNLMLAESGIAVTENYIDLISVLQRFKNDPQFTRPYDSEIE